MSSMRLFIQELPLEQAVQHLRRLSLRDLINVWLSGKGMHIIIDSDKALLKRLGVSSFEEFLTRTNALLKSDTRQIEKLKELQNMVIDDGLPIATAEFLVKAPKEILNSLFDEESLESFCEIVDLDSQEQLIQVLPDGAFDGFFASLHEGVLTRDEIFYIYSEIQAQEPVLFFEMDNLELIAPNQYAQGHNLTEAQLKLLLTTSLLNGANAYRANLIHLNDFLQMDYESLMEWMDVWLGSSDPLEPHNLSLLRQYNDFISDWKQTNATSKVELIARLNDLPANIQYEVISKVTTLESAENFSGQDASEEEASIEGPENQAPVFRR